MHDGLPFAFRFLRTRELKRRSGDLPLVVQVSYPDFLAALDAHRLPGGNTYKTLDVPDQTAVNRATDGVRACRV